ncbi:MAG TPA: endopeptidase La, partial [Cytophagales bacterium]|nr:endopeptidase La [Cytophagales bacterium]
MNNDNKDIKLLTLGSFLEDEGAEMIPLLSPEEDDFVKKIPDTIPILPVKNTVLFPGVVIPITVSRQKSIKLVKKAYKGDRVLGVVAQSKATSDDPGIEDIYKIGTVAHILKMLVLPDGNTTIIIQGKSKFEVAEFIQKEPFITAKIKVIKDNFPSRLNKEQKALIQSIKDSSLKILKLNPEIPKEAQFAIDNIETPSFLTHFLSSNLNVEVKDKQGILEVNDGIERAHKLLGYLLKEIQLLEIKLEINSKVNHDIDQQQRDYFLRQQMKVLQDELGFDTPEKEVDALRQKAISKNLPEYVLKHLNKELDKLLRINPQSAEYPVSYNYCELITDLPWTEGTKDNLDLTRAKKILDADHFGMDKVKERILEYLAVIKLKHNLKSPILCLYGPPGVGKTSLGKSIAKALGRKYVRMSLGGVHDEAEIRGHRKTYIGAMPGRIIQGIKKGGSNNPVFILDEIDKVSSNHRGDPSSALLEVLDPEQNSAFSDNYLELDFDLSKVMFIATSNAMDTIHPALRDRMEIIELTGYTIEEKAEIAKKHIIPKQKEDHGIPTKALNFSHEAIIKIIEGYTRESGVRNLEREIGSVIRKIAKKIASEEPYKKTLKAEDIIALLGTEKYEKEDYQNSNIAGIVIGLAWTPVGGDILYIESSLSKGKGKITVSGQLGDVMKESASTALSYLKAHSEEYRIDHRIFDHYDLHIHVPAGAVPKDGPSAGITIATSLASIYTQRKVKNNLAMTGEITLRGKVLPVGGIKEKILAAKRAGIQD